MLFWVEVQKLAVDGCPEYPITKPLAPLSILRGLFKTLPMQTALLTDTVPLFTQLLIAGCATSKE
jgi:hypothetical protein